MQKPWVSWVLIGITVISVLFGVLERSYAQSLIKQVDRHETALTENTKTLSTLVSEVRVLRFLLERLIEDTKPNAKP